MKYVGIEKWCTYWRHKMCGDAAAAAAVEGGREGVDHR
jgi:hypothetical protein